MVIVSPLSLLLFNFLCEAAVLVFVSGFPLKSFVALVCVGHWVKGGCVVSLSL